MENFLNKGFILGKGRKNKNIINNSYKSINKIKKISMEVHKKNGEFPIILKVKQFIDNNFLRD